jgi:hypothetical protein
MTFDAMSLDEVACLRGLGCGEGGGLGAGLLVPFGPQVGFASESNENGETPGECRPDDA